MRSRLALLLIAVGLAVPASAQAKPVMLLFHPGGFFFGSPEMMHSAVSYARSQGFQPVNVDYPTDHFPGVFRYSKSVAQKYAGRKEFAYGESAGGSIAARLAELGLVKKAAVQAPVTDVPTFIEPSEEYFGKDWSVPAAWLSPDRHPSEKPIKAWVPADDPLSPDTWAWAKRDPLVVGQGIPGKHLQRPYRDAAMRAGIDYLTP